MLLRVAESVVERGVRVPFSRENLDEGEKEVVTEALARLNDVEKGQEQQWEAW